MVENNQCSNNKCPMYKSGFTTSCINCIYKTNNKTHRNYSNQQKNNFDFNNFRNNKKTSDHPESFKNISEDISSLTYNYGEEINLKDKMNNQFDDIQTVYNTQSNFKDFYKVHKKKKIHTSTILLILSICVMLCLSIFIILKFL